MQHWSLYTAAPRCTPLHPTPTHPPRQPAFNLALLTYLPQAAVHRLGYLQEVLALGCEPASHQPAPAYFPQAAAHRLGYPQEVLALGFERPVPLAARPGVEAALCRAAAAVGLGQPVSGCACGCRPAGGSLQNEWMNE